MKTVTGNPIVISDAKGGAVEELKVSFTPKQNLNGYSKPWAGGAGENLIPFVACVDQTRNGITFKNNADGSVHVSGTPTAEALSSGNNVLQCDEKFLTWFEAGTYTLSSTGGKLWCQFTNEERATQTITAFTLVNGRSRTVTFNEKTAVYIRADVTVSDGTVDADYKASVVKGSTAPTEWTPYANICPITGIDSIDVVANSDTHEFDLGRTAYGGTLDIKTGVLTVTDASIASYNGETLPSTWISDRDEYKAGTTPTIGAQVVYKLATPLTYYLTPHEVSLLEKNNTISASDGTITVTYDEIDTFLAYDTEIVYLLTCLSGDEDFDSDFTPKSRVGDLLYSYLTGATPTIYTDPIESRVEYLMKYWLGFESKSSYISLPPRSRVEAILSSKIEGTSYTGEALSDVEKLLIRITI